MAHIFVLLKNEKRKKILIIILEFYKTESESCMVCVSFAKCQRVCSEMKIQGLILVKDQGH